MNATDQILEARAAIAKYTFIDVVGETIGQAIQRVMIENGVKPKNDGARIVVSPDALRISAL